MIKKSLIEALQGADFFMFLLSQHKFCPLTGLHVDAASLEKSMPRCSNSKLARLGLSE